MLRKTMIIRRLANPPPPVRIQVASCDINLKRSTVREAAEILDELLMGMERAACFD